ncbi:MAG TPA: hypothetical protein VFA48_05565 [Gammaproteobacteria bacterium]|nr:hypothetical protein [Gammaproteobacteria bacterium]
MKILVNISPASPELLADLEARPKRGRAQRLRELAQIGLGVVRGHSSEAVTNHSEDAQAHSGAAGANAASHSDALIDQLGGSFDDDPDS